MIAALAVPGVVLAIFLTSLLLVGGATCLDVGSGGHR